jgi:hypothetical protein
VEGAFFFLFLHTIIGGLQKNAFTCIMTVMNSVPLTMEAKMVTCYIADELLRKHGVDSDEGLDADIISRESNPALWQAFMEGIMVAWQAEMQVQQAKEKTFGGAGSE